MTALELLCRSIFLAAGLFAFSALCGCFLGALIRAGDDARDESLEGLGEMHGEPDRIDTDQHHAG